MKGLLGFNVEDLLQEILVMQCKLMDGLMLLLLVEDVDYGVIVCEEVWWDGKVVLYWFIGIEVLVYLILLLIVYVLVNWLYMVDLQVDCLLVQKLLVFGYDVYVLDWGYLDCFECYQMLEDYLLWFIDGVVDYLCVQFGGLIDMFGICQGGVFVLCYVVLCQYKLVNLVMMVMLVDFYIVDNMFLYWVWYVDVDLLVDMLGNILVDLMNVSYLMFKLFWFNVQKYVGLFDILDDKVVLEDFLCMEKWIFDLFDFVGEVFCDFIKQFYQGNGLMYDGVWIGEEYVDLCQVMLLVFNIYVEQDYFVLLDVLCVMCGWIGSSDYIESSFCGGYIGIYVFGCVQCEVFMIFLQWLKE